jgi:hypothetical protein
MPFFRFSFPPFALLGLRGDGGGGGGGGVGGGVGGGDVMVVDCPS